MRYLLKLIPISRSDAAKVAEVMNSLPVREFVATTLFISITMIALPLAILALSAHEGWI
jgi:hypothetical protein